MMVVDSTKSWPMPAPAHTAPKSTPEQPGCAAPELQLLVLQPSLSVCSNHDGLRAPDHHRPAHGGNPAGLQRQPSAGCVSVPRVGALLRLVLCPRGPTCVARHARLHIGWRGCAHVRVASVVWCCHLGCTEYRTISAVNGPLVVLDNVKVRRPACVRMQ